MVEPRSSAYLLVTHGSRDPRPDQLAQQLAVQLSTELSARRQAVPSSEGRTEQTVRRSPGGGGPMLLTTPVLVGTATLELADQPLQHQIVQFAERAIGHGITQIRVLPLFLLPGVHVMEDIPAAVAQAQGCLGDRAQIMPLPYLGAAPVLRSLLQAQAQTVSVEAWVLMAHGSRRPGANTPITALAATIGALPAYWALAPSLGDRLAELLDQGQGRVGIVPYVLFPGGITDAIAAQIETLTAAHPQHQFCLLSPVGLWAGIVPAIAQLALSPDHHPPS